MLDGWGLAMGRNYDVLALRMAAGKAMEEPRVWRGKDQFENGPLYNELSQQNYCKMRGIKAQVLQ
jgi:hypothetical protein